MLKRRLNLGCGKDIKPKEEGWINMDYYYKGEGVDIIHNLIEFPYPFEDEYFDELYASHVLEHIPFIYINKDGILKDIFFLFMEELYRILKPKGILTAITPYSPSQIAFGNIQHYRHFNERWVEQFIPDAWENFYTTARFNVISVEFTNKEVILPYFLRIGRSKLGIFHHLSERIPFFKPLLKCNPSGLKVVLEKI